MAELSLETYGDYEHVCETVNICGQSKVQVDKLEISFDGGRLNVYLNGEECYSTIFAGNDWSLTFNNK